MSDTTDQYIIETAKLCNIQSSYIIQTEVGRGSFGIVHKVRKKHTRREYACKTLRKNDQTPIHIIQREIHSLRDLHHPHIIELQDVFEEAKFIHIISELCTGGELYERIGSGDWNATEKESAKLLQNILSAIAYLHQNGVIHRDLKASNFLFGSKNTNTNIKIIDFGLARKLRRREDGSIDKEERLTTKVGTPYYVAPEVLLQDSYDSKCDVWSIGVISFLVLSRGKLPYCGEDEKETCTMLKNPELGFCFEPTEIWSELDESAKAFCRGLLQKDPAVRPSAEEALHLDWLQIMTTNHFSPHHSHTQFRSLILNSRKVMDTFFHRFERRKPIRPPRENH